MRKMYDSTTAADCPPDGDLYAGYVDGRYAWSAQDWARFPGKVLVRIAVLATTNDGHVLDVETGAASPVQAPGWAARRRAAGADPSVYVNLSNADAVRAAFDAAAMPQPHYWLAHYDQDPAIPAGYVAKQYADAAQTGGHYDASSVADYWPGVDDMTTAQVQAMIDASIAAYGQRLQAELDANYAAKAHPHTASAAGQVIQVPGPTVTVT